MRSMRPSNICFLCLSTNRSIFCLPERHRRLFSYLTDGYPQTYAQVCWECRGSLQRFYSFKEQAERAVRALESARTGSQPMNLQCLSKLSLAQIIVIDLLVSEDQYIDTRSHKTAEPTAQVWSEGEEQDLQNLGADGIQIDPINNVIYIEDSNADVKFENKQSTDIKPDDNGKRIGATENKTESLEDQSDVCCPLVDAPLKTEKLKLELGLKPEFDDHLIDECDSLEAEACSSETHQLDELEKRKRQQSSQKRERKCALERELCGVNCRKSKSVTGNKYKKWYNYHACDCSHESIEDWRKRGADVRPTIAMSDECGDMMEPAVTVEPPDTSSLDSASTVKTEPAGVADVYSLEETIVKEEMEIEPTVIRPPDFVYMQRPCNQEPVEDTPAGKSISVESQEDCASDKSYSIISDQVDARTASVDNNDSRPHRCHTCNKSFKLNCRLKIHIIKKHTVERPYNCDVCNKCFTMRRFLKLHMKIHTGERPYICEICNKTFTRNFDFKKHSVIHTGERPYNCNVCSKCFTRHDILLVHMKIHTGERPYNCEICKKCFTQRGNLTTHMKTHIGERPYNCKICKKCFTQRGNLTTHMKTHIGERPYNCKICKKRFISTDYLKRHSKIHTGERPFKCEVCNKSYIQHGGLIKHMKMHI